MKDPKTFEEMNDEEKREYCKKMGYSYSSNGNDADLHFIVTGSYIDNNALKYP
jgi:hypothetical protein